MWLKIVKIHPLTNFKRGLKKWLQNNTYPYLFKRSHLAVWLFCSSISPSELLYFWHPLTFIWTHICSNVSLQRLLYVTQFLWPQTHFGARKECFNVAHTAPYELIAPLCHMKYGGAVDGVCYALAAFMYSSIVTQLIHAAAAGWHNAKMYNIAC